MMGYILLSTVQFIGTYQPGVVFPQLKFSLACKSISILLTTKPIKVSGLDASQWSNNFATLPTLTFWF
jgi:hypothetical protein